MTPHVDELDGGQVVAVLLPPSDGFELSRTVRIVYGGEPGREAAEVLRQYPHADAYCLGVGTDPVWFFFDPFAHVDHLGPEVLDDADA